MDKVQKELERLYKLAGQKEKCKNCELMEPNKLDKLVQQHHAIAQKSEKDMAKTWFETYTALEKCVKDAAKDAVRAAEAAKAKQKEDVLTSERLRGAYEMFKKSWEEGEKKRIELMELKRMEEFYLKLQECIRISKLKKELVPEQSSEGLFFFIPINNVPSTILPSGILLICLVVFIIGLIGLAVVNNNLLIILMSIEIMFFGLGLFSIFFSIFSTDPIGFIIALVLVTTSAAETVIGLSLLVRYCVLFDNINIGKVINPYFHH